MKFEMTTPCADCPFRTDVEPYLQAERVREIRDTLTRDQGTFTCHKTTVPDPENDSRRMDGKNAQHCAGAMILLEKTNSPNQMMRIAERLQAYDRTKLAMDAPVFDSFAEMAAAQSDGGLTSRSHGEPPGGEAIWTYLHEECDGRALIVEVAEHFECGYVEIVNCVDDTLPDGAEGLEIYVGYSTGFGAVATDEDEHEIEAY
jgi:hypothetical protein